MIVGNVCCLGWGGIIANWEYRGSKFHAILISPLSKESHAVFAHLGERLTYCTCLLLEIKRAGFFYFFNFFWR